MLIKVKYTVQAQQLRNIMKIHITLQQFFVTINFLHDMHRMKLGEPTYPVATADTLVHAVIAWTAATTETLVHAATVWATTTTETVAPCDYCDSSACCDSMDNCHYWDNRVINFVTTVKVVHAVIVRTMKCGIQLECGYLD